MAILARSPGLTDRREADMGGAVEGTRTERSVALPLATRLLQHLAPVAVVAVVVTVVLALAYVRMPEHDARPQGHLAAADSAAALVDARLAALAEAKERGDYATARTAWRDAYRALRRSPDWHRLAQLGDTALELGGVTGKRQAGAEDARRAYLGALVRARAEGSIDGVLRATEGFATLGDRDVVDEGLRIADSLAARSQAPDARERVMALRMRLEHPQAAIGRAAGPSRTTWDP